MDPFTCLCSPAFLIEPARHRSNNDGLRNAFVITTALTFRGTLGGAELLLSPEPSFPEELVELGEEDVDFSPCTPFSPDFLLRRGSLTVTAMRNPRKIPGMPGKMNAHLHPC